ncbi:unnamed protein product [Rotaria magnacalcarata]|uniref:Disease resistance R13L4/SHOC-2-like LRR domain-containing protein n=2 Tax=Rotaria magnacalcarata TaxID=392030 RepID=A0A816RNN8_9BILA|nr:unnamed protein product [Rotaria magnacalcarata]CAF1923308.1 unnamed protein product [Rotaria magnacalcarata]CAF2075019.1 unnamed protein product [Rotaria magnacalcarata]CAF2134130.1 unnamed protein product [Rotaria magnacalcarata]CAF3744784.1 unnamed protein product [Rotaria magnacalcarata]
MPTAPKRQRSFVTSNVTDGTGSTIEHSKQVRIVRTQSRLRMLVEQLPNGRKRLHLKGIDTIAIPTELYELTDLDILDVTPESKSGMNYTLSRVPADFRFLINLKCLHLDNNNIVSFPAEIGELPHLETLTVSNNHLTTLPDQIRQLQRLQSCHLSNNKIEDMPSCLCYLSKSLLFLDLSYNYLRQIPSSIHNLKQLRTLLLLGNRIKTLPDSVCQLSKLETLWLGDNKLTELPKSFPQLKHLDWYHHCELSSNFEGNPLVNPPLDVCRKGMDAIEQYLKKTPK